MMLKLVTHSPEETQTFGKRCGELSIPGDIFLLTGELGAGKTCLTQGIAFGLGIKEYALSPTFVIMRQLKGRLPLYHIDLYRLDRLEETTDRGLDDYFYGDGISVVEWAEKAMSLMPHDHLLIQIEYLDGSGRLLKLKPEGKRYQEIVRELKKDFKLESGD
jgi:tRNA threonylcarbamoyladenosine biosynthesis protein TsaE